MKKLASLALAVLMIAALCISASAADLKAAKGTPVIDGVMDDAYKAATEIKIVNELNGTNGKTKGTAYTLWDDKNIYVFFDVIDPKIEDNKTAEYWNGDSVEFFINLSGEAAGDITTINAAQYTAPSLYRDSDTVWQGRGGHWDANHDAATFKTVKTDAGYAVEMQIPFGANYTAKEGAKITVAYHINSDETGDTARDEEIFAGDASAQSQAWNIVDSYDPMVLSADVYVEPTEDAPAADNTADAGIVVAAVVMACAAAVVLSKKSK